MSDERPRVSVVLPSHNGARYLDDAIDSWQQQTYADWELIVVDDASVDDTPARARAWCVRDRRIRLVRHHVKRRLPAALNTGFALTRGEYLTWTSDDNLARPHALAELVAFLDAHVEVDVVYADYGLIDEAGASLGRVEVGDPATLTNGNCVGACFLYRCRVQTRVGPYAEDLVLAEDYDFWLRASIDFTLKAYHRDLYCYRVHPGSLTSRHQVEAGVLADRALARHLGRMRWLDRRTRAATFMSLAARAARRGQPLVAATLIVSAIGESPATVSTRVLRRLAQRVRR